MNNDPNPFDTALKTQATRHTASDQLRKRIANALNETPVIPSKLAPVLAIGHWFTWRSMAMGFAAGALCAVLGTQMYLRVGSDERLGDEIVSSHVRALMTNHLTDVISTDQHTVKPWFAGKLDFAPPVWNARPDEFPLQGGRVDYLNQQAVAALVYKRNEHVINLFIWPLSRTASQVDQASTELPARQGYQSLKWVEAGMQFWAISDVNAAELLRFRTLSRAGN